MTVETDWLFINWIGYHGRSDDLSTQLSARDVYITGGEGNRIVRYVSQWRETRRVVRDADASIVFVMQPPVLALWAVRSAVGNGTLIVADLHTGVFTDRKWSWAAKGILRSLRRCGGAVIVTNEVLAQRCRVEGTTTYVLDDAVPCRVGSAPVEVEAPELRVLVPDDYVLVPLAYASDEPLDEILSAAAVDLNRTWVFTGRAPEAIKAKASKNVLFSGFVSNDDYNWLAANAGVTLACTDEEHTMQRAGYEAVSWERPLVTSKMTVLVEYFGDSAEFADPKSAAIYAAIDRAFDRRAELIDKIAALGERKRAEHASSLAEIRASLEAAAKG